MATRIMRALLIDFEFGGHHVEYASRLLEELITRGIDATMLAGGPTTRYEDMFAGDRIEYLFEDGDDFANRLDSDPDGARDAAFERLERILDTTYDVVHFLHVDNMLKECYRNLRQWDNVPIIASLNGNFFNRPLFRDRPLTIATDRMFHPLVADYLPIRNNRATLYRCLQEGVFDHLFVPTEGAKRSLKRFIPAAIEDPITVVPDPIDPWYDRLPETTHARTVLNLNASGPVMLVFGQMRAEKGIPILINALEAYDGIECTFLLAGPPADVSETQLSVQNPAISLDVRAEFVPEESVPMYFAAADGAVFPYRRNFGTVRPSGVFGKACASHLPIVGPNFGFFKKRIEGYDLGMTFEAGDSTSLARTLESFVAGLEETIDESRFEEYVESQSFEQLAERTANTYERVQSRTHHPTSEQTSPPT